MTNAIQRVLNESSVCRQIVEFLRENRNAMDSVRGVATWWLRCDESVAQAALDRLVECGLVSVHTLPSGAVYSLTRTPEVRRWLQTFSPGRVSERRATVGTSVTLILADLPDDASGEEVISATPIGQLLNDNFARS